MNRKPVRTGSQLVLAIVQPYLPAYNVPFFQRLGDRLRQDGIALSVIHGKPDSLMAARRDGGVLPNTYEVDTRIFGPLPLDWKRTASAIRSVRPDFVILEHARAHVESYGLIMKSLTGGPRVAWWGHGKSYGMAESGLAAAWRQRLLYSGDWFFAYTDGGADYVVERGFPRSRVSVVNNTIDTGALLSDMAKLSREEIDDFLDQNDAVAGHTGLFIGGVDLKKGIPFLLEAAAEIRQADGDFTLLVAGSGEMEAFVQSDEARRRGVRPLGRVTGRSKALALSAADVMLVPREVGLVAVDSLASGTPIITTAGAGHGPEFEYLSPDRDACVVTGEGPRPYAEAVVSLLQDPGRLARMGAAATLRAEALTMDRMVEAFAQGVLDWVEVATHALGRAKRMHS